MLKFFGLCLALFCLSAAPARALDLHGLPADALALWVAPVEGDQVFRAYRDQLPVSPASTMKILTSWSALERLGPDFTWKTTLVTTAPVRDGVVQGDVYWVGPGDPHFFREQLANLLEGLRLRGIHAIQGRLLLDGSVFSRISSADGFDPDGGESFMTPPEPWLTNLNVAWLHFFNDDSGARVELDPPLAGFTLVSRLQRGGDQTCPDVRRFVHVEQQGSRMTVSGVLPQACDGAMSYQQPLAPDQFAGAAFSGLWQQMGGSGPDGMAHGTAPTGARVLSSVMSPPLARILPDMNKFSSNPMARALFLTLGRNDVHSGDTVEDAAQAVRQTLAAHHLDDAGLVLENGAGLSRRERISARLLGEVLREAARGPYASELLSSLPVAGQLGTMKHRLGDEGPWLRMKTGSLDDVSALAGIWQAQDGRRLVVVALLQAAQVERYKPALDAVVRDVIRQYSVSGI
jgi:D-alanyl-D-alanine carboxypeptidase/D-alanyl-D-alanine-endopeptidase (penicillin-binding protein 4)